MEGARDQERRARFWSAPGPVRRTPPSTRLEAPARHKMLQPAGNFDFFPPVRCREGPALSLKGCCSWAAAPSAFSAPAPAPAALAPRSAMGLDAKSSIEATPVLPNVASPPFLTNSAPKCWKTSQTLRSSLTHIRYSFSFSFLARSSTSEASITALSVKSTLFWTSTMHMLPHSSVTFLYQASIASKEALSVVEKARMQAPAPL
mmetsp:Transcript_103202/g.272738  ORF Transcript_103202/g.272738 Transcript_103202/m.272738 type:complete len:204 (-) Transcript_103202:357-968(-)